MATNNIKTTGKVLLVSYNDSKFIELCEKNRGAYILDARQKGWSSNEQLKSSSLQKKFGIRYKLMPDLALVAGESSEDFVEKATEVIVKIRNAAEAGKSVIITSFNSALLKCIGHMIMCANPEIKTFLKWETDEEEGISKQKPMSDDEFAEKLEKLCEKLEVFTATNNEEFDEDLF